MLTLRNVIEIKIDKGEELLLTFIDLKAAFGTIDRREIWRTFNNMEVN